MKKLFPIVLLIVALLAVSCGTVQEAIVEEPVVEEPVVEEPAPVATDTIVILNNALPLLETSSQCYNATAWVDAYSMKDIIETNFWFQPKADTLCVSAQISDFGYSDVITYGGDPTSATAYLTYGFVNRYASFGYKDEDLYTGSGSNYSYRAYFTGVTTVGNEALFFMQPAEFDEVEIADLFLTVQNSTNNSYCSAQQTVVEASSWTFVAVDGTTLVLTAAEMEDATLVPSAEGYGADVVCGDKSLANVRSFAPSDLTKDSAVVEGVVYRFTVVANAEGVYGVAAPVQMNVAGTYYPTATTKSNALAGCYSMADLFEAYNVAKCDSVAVISYVDGYSRDEAWDLFTAKYAAWHKSHELITLGAVQSKKDDSIWNIGYFVTDNVVFAYVSEDGLAIADAIAYTGTTPAELKFTFVDGRTYTVPYEFVSDFVAEAGTQILTVECF